ncbi:MAG: S8 family peptidase [Haliangiales bacterium]
MKNPFTHRIPAWLGASCAAFTVAALAAGCGSDATAVSGSISVISADQTQPASAAASSAQLAQFKRFDVSEQRLAGARAAMLSGLDRADFVVGDVIVAFRGDRVGAQGALSTMQVAGAALTRARSLHVEHTHLYQAQAADRAATIAAIEALNQRPDVLFAQPNYIYQPMLEPNDPGYQFQWHYPIINLPQAWEVTIGDPSTVVAVVDTGILASPQAGSTHPDLIGKVLPGFDFISNPQIAVDGDGRDSDAFDEGDNPGEQSSYHGSHVAGTIAASTDDEAGVAGVNWQAQILPIRALGAGGGSVTDILDGVRWAAGLSVSGLPDNPNPADVINLSLGGTAQCSLLEQQVYDEVAAKGSIVVVAAGNENQNAANVSPASCSGVITVGAVGPNLQRAPYSNFGARVDVMAPGGDQSRDGEDGVLSLGFNDADREFGFTFLQGTSMAAPHVAGVVSLMRGVRPDLTTADAVAILRATARPVSDVDCGVAGGCGAGLIDAAAALRVVSGDDPDIPLPTDSGLVVVGGSDDFGSDSDEITMTIRNNTDSVRVWAVEGFSVPPSNPGVLDAATLFVVEGSPRSGIVDSQGVFDVKMGLNRDIITVDGIYTVDLRIELDGEVETVPVRFNTLAAGADPTGTTVVAALYLDENNEVQIGAAQTEDAFFSNYRLDVDPGEYEIIAWSDVNGNGRVDNGDYGGGYPELVDVAEGRTLSGLDFEVGPILEVGQLSAMMTENVKRSLALLLAFQQQ